MIEVVLYQYLPLCDETINKIAGANDFIVNKISYRYMEREECFLVYGDTSLAYPQSAN